MTATLRERVLYFASAPRACVRRVATPPEQGLQEAWLPVLGGEYVRNAGDPPHGFASSYEALDAARRFRESCKQWLKDNP